MDLICFLGGGGFFFFFWSCFVLFVCFVFFFGWRNFEKNWCYIYIWLPLIHSACVYFMITHVCIHWKRKWLTLTKHVRRYIDLCPPELYKIRQQHVYCWFYENECYLGKKYASEESDYIPKIYYYSLWATIFIWSGFIFKLVNSWDFRAMVTKIESTFVQLAIYLKLCLV